MHRLLNSKTSLDDALKVIKDNNRITVVGEVRTNRIRKEDTIYIQEIVVDQVRQLAA